MAGQKGQAAEFWVDGQSFCPGLQGSLLGRDFQELLGAEILNMILNLDA